MDIEEENKNTDKGQEINQEQKNHYIEIGGFVLGFVDQVSDILVIFSNQFASQNLYWAAVGIWVFNMTIVSLVCFYSTVQAKYWIPISEQKKEYSPYLFARISDFILKLIVIIIKFIITILSCIIANILAIFMVWFGFTKLFFLNEKIQSFFFTLLFSGKDLKNHEKQQQINKETNFNNKIHPISIINTDNDNNKIGNNQNNDNNKQTNQNNYNSQNNKIYQGLQIVISNKNKTKAYSDENLKQLKDLNIEEFQDLEQYYHQKNLKVQQKHLQNVVDQQQQQKNIKNEEKVDKSQKKEKRKYNRSYTILVDFHLKMEIIEKLLENLPQLILQIINQTMGGYQNQTLNILSIIFSILNIVYNIFVIVKMSSQELQDYYDFVINKLKEFGSYVLDKIIKPLANFNLRILKFLMKNIQSFIIWLTSNQYFYLITCLSIQIALYTIVVKQYEWNDYVSYKDTSYSKDADDSIRAFIIMFPICLASQFISNIMYVFSKPEEIESYYYFVMFSIWAKNVFLITFLIDVLSFRPEHLQYGQQILGTTGLLIMYIISLFLSFVDCIIMFYFKNDKIEYLDSYQNWMSLFLFLILGIYFIKSFSWFINYAHYYDWTPYGDKNGDCNEDLESILKGVLILYLFRFINSINVIGSGDFSICCSFLSSIALLILDSMLLDTLTKHSYCDDLRYVQRHNYNIILNIIADIILFFLPCLMAIFKKEQNYNH